MVKEKEEYVCKLKKNLYGLKQVQGNSIGILCQLWSIRLQED